MKTKILFVDDNKTIIDSYINAFKNIERFNIIGAAEDGEQAINLINKNDIDIIILDIIMPNIDGVEVLKYINSHFKVKRPKIIITSIVYKESIIRDLYRQSIDYFILKPFLIEKLICRIDEIQNDINYNSKEWHYEIIQKINHLGVPIHSKGYHYIKESISFVIKLGLDTDITRVYKHIANVYDTSEKSIEKAIRKCLEYTFEKGNIYELNKLFEYNISSESGKASNKKFIYQIAQNMINEYKLL